MVDVTRLLDLASGGNAQAAKEVWPLVYEELRQLAAGRLVHEGHSLNATDLVHEAYLRLVGPKDECCWENRRHFFGAAAEAMRRILVDRARARKALKRGAGKWQDFDMEQAPADENQNLVELNDALDELAAVDASSAELVKLRYFAGLTMKQAAVVLGISARTADFWWSYARAWLMERVKPSE